MINFIEISVEPSLLPHVARDLLHMASDPDHVRASTGESGPVLLVHPVLAEAWYKKVANEEVEESTTTEPEVVEASTDESVTPVPVVEAPVAQAPTPESAPASSAQSATAPAVPTSTPAPVAATTSPTVPVVANGEVDDSTSTPVVANEKVQDSSTSEPEVQLPVKRGPGRPRKVTSASPSEVL